MTAFQPLEPPFVFGVDLDGVVADFIGGLRPIAAEWLGKDPEDLTPEPSYGFPEWGLDGEEYERLHRFAVVERDLFANLQPLSGGPPALRRLSNEGVRTRTITHRLYIKHFHETAILQTVRWLDHQGIPYWDLCFMRDKRAVGAELYVEDSPSNIEALKESGAEVIIFDNSTNRQIDGLRAHSWEEVEKIVMERLQERYRTVEPDEGIQYPTSIH
jgi:5'(3')-deoxyribonucleotidase